MNIRELIKRSYFFKIFKRSYFFKIFVKVFYKLLRKYALYFLEPLGIDTYSKPYAIESIEYHNNILNEFNFSDGFFIEIGAFNGFFHSPTYYFEKFKGWKGVLVEPNPYFIKECRKNRKASKVYNAACVSFDYKDDTIMFNNCNHSSHTLDSKYNDSHELKQSPIVLENKKIFTVPARTLTEILEDYFLNQENCRIDIFVLDVEEHELDVLKGLDFSKYYPENILVECHTENHKENINKYLVAKGYFCKKLISHQDYLFSRM